MVERIKKSQSNLETLQTALTHEIVADLSGRYPEAFESLLNRDPDEIKQILDLQTRAEEIVRQMGNSDMDSPQCNLNFRDLVTGLQDKTLSAARAEIEKKERAKLFMSFTGPGGAGKDTVTNDFVALMEQDGIQSAKVKVSTTRDQRPGEVEGKDYYFIDDEKLLELLSRVDFSEDLRSQLEKLGINPAVDGFNKELLEEIKTKNESKGVTLFFDNSANKTSVPIYLTYNPGRGWYTIVTDEVTDATEKSPLALAIEDPKIVVKVIEASMANDPSLIGKIVCVLPPHPMIFHMALRAITRDEILAKKSEPLSSESLFSTIGERQLDILHDFTEIPTQMLVVVVNDKFENGLTTASVQLHDAFKGIAGEEKEG